jgi:hypothetical protein
VKLLTLSKDSTKKMKQQVTRFGNGKVYLTKHQHPGYEKNFTNKTDNPINKQN